MADSPTAKPDDVSDIVIDKVERELKSRANNAARKRGLKLREWMIEAIREKLQRESG